MYKIFPTITPKFRREILWFASLHDIGKIGIPDNILLKPGKLTPEEFDIMKQHVLFGENILKDMDGKIQNMTGFSFMKTAIDIAGGHHEKWDGSGYPRKLSGHDIPLAGRIVALADVFDALTSARPYKKAFDFDLSVRMIIEQSGSHFDPDVVHAFTTGLDSIRRIYDRYRE
ncbi:Cyclic di-GMP phosphodiesterase [bioreactor metagenome]|uniref:Cyclic di-GMP phosphodiesterase n=1 Tax=bioreactor metagenome TaxID=1076179 RepID=A0A645GDW6_9ZZZZ